MVFLMENDALSAQHFSAVALASVFHPLAGGLLYWRVCCVCGDALVYPEDWTELMVFTVGHQRHASAFELFYPQQVISILPLEFIIIKGLDIVHRF